MTMTATPGLILGPGPEGWWDSSKVSSPQVVRLPDGRWRMYYYGRDAGFDPDVALPDGRVGVVESTDGVHWERVAGPLTMGAVLEPHPNPDRFDSTHVGVSDIHFWDGLWWLWYFGGDAATGESGDARRVMKGLRMRCGLAVSRDGFHFYRVNGPHHGGAILDMGAPGEFDEFFAAWPRVLRPEQPGEPWKLYYHTRDQATKRFYPGLALSDDGLNWRKVGPILEPGTPGSWNEVGAACRSILRIDGQYVMFYEALNFEGYYCIGIATSADGISWSNEADPVFCHADAGAWDDYAVGTPNVIQLDDGSFRMYYIGGNKPGPGRPFAPGIGLAVSDRTNYRSWKRWGE